jgi:hypothetical protein
VIKTRYSIDIRFYLIFLFGFFGTTIVCSLFTFLAAMLNTRSVQLLKFWQSQTRVRNEIIGLVSLKPLEVSVGSFYVLKKSTPGTYFRIIFDATLNALLGF